MDRYAFDTMKNGYNRYQVEDYIQTQKLQMESLQKKLEKANLLKEELTREYQELETRYRDVSENLEVKEKAADEMTRMAMKEANMIVDTAHRNADAIVEESLMMARGILMEVPLLFEVHWEDAFDEVWVVACDEELLLSRLKLYRHISKEEALRRLRLQLPQQEKIKRADVVFYNNSDSASLKRQICDILNMKRQLR
mgnify:CR=1 FL=1